MALGLIFNADDYGLTPEVSRGIRDVHLRGIVTSTTCMMNLPGTIMDIRRALDITPLLGLGVHLNLTAGAPRLHPLQISSLCTREGRFFKRDELISRLNMIDISQVKAEWRAQIQTFLVTAQKSPTHLDSHHHSSYFTPALFRAMLELAQEFDCAIRLPVLPNTLQLTGLPEEVTEQMQTEFEGLVREFNPRRPDGFLASFYDKTATPEEVFQFVEGLAEGVYEVMCHPGYADPYLVSVTGYAHPRQNELEVLTNPNFRDALKAQGVQAFVNFANRG